MDPEGSVTNAARRSAKAASRSLAAHSSAARSMYDRPASAADSMALSRNALAARESFLSMAN